MQSFRDISIATLRKGYRSIPAGVRNILDAALLFDLPDRRPQRIAISAEESVLLLTSEHGTGILGSGGTLALHLRRAAPIQSLVIRRNKRQRNRPQSDVDGMPSSDERTFLDAAFQSIGLLPQIVMNEPPEIGGNRVCRNILTHILTGDRPAIIYHPSLFSPVDEDRWINQILWHALIAIHRERRGWNPILRGYEFNQPLLANRYCDISETGSVKQDAIGRIIPDILTQREGQAIIALNTYRSQAMQGGIGLAEAFQDLNFAAFDQIMTNLGTRYERTVHP